jgi:hypothetical protein
VIGAGFSAKAGQGPSSWHSGEAFAFFVGVMSDVTGSDDMDANPFANREHALSFHGQGPGMICWGHLAGGRRRGIEGDVGWRMSRGGEER